MKTTRSKVLGLAVLFSLFSSLGFAQKKDSTNNEEGKNLIKLNIPTLAIKTFSVQYERAIHKKMSVGLGIRLMPKGKVPFVSSIKSDNVDLETLKLGNFSLTPEVKFYLGSGVFKGFYIAPFLRYAHYNTALDIKFDVNVMNVNRTEVIPVSGALNTYTAGVLVGAQWSLGSKFYLDWSILGPQYGISTGNLAGNKKLDVNEQQALRDELSKIEKDLPFGKIKYDVNANGANVDIDGPWAGIRANVGIGYRF